MSAKRIVVLAALALALGAAAPGGASAADSDCASDSLQATCDTLDTCDAIGALNMTAPPNDAVAFYRNCMFTDHRYKLIAGNTGALARSRTTLPKLYASTFWPLYCDAVERAGRTDRAICGVRTSAGSGSGSSGSTTHRHSRSHRRRSPRFTG